MKIDTYYDISCGSCGRHASTDFEMGLFESKKVANEWAKKEVWKTKENQNICPICLKNMRGR